MSELRFTAQCKNDGHVYAYYFGGREQYENLKNVTAIFVWALYKRRFTMGHKARITQRENLWRFLRFLNEQGVSKARELSADTLKAYIHWLKQQTSITYATAGSHFRLLSPTFLQMSKHPDVSPDFVPIRNPFPKSSSLQTANEGYDQQELKSIINAAAIGMRETISKLGNKYQPVWLDKPAPLEDVAPFSGNGGHSFWNSFEYKIWWWENHCNSQRLTSPELYGIPQGQVFINSFKIDSQPGMVGVRKFYDAIGAGFDYIPKYLNKPCPIKYRTPWKKIDYLVWFWENKLDCQVITESRLKHQFPEFYGAIKEHFNGRFREFYRDLGLCAWVSALDLVPFYIMLLVRTQLNPSTIQRLTTESLINDPLDPKKKLVSWVKYRSSKQGLGISSDKDHDGWPVMLINKIIQITAGIRADNQIDLWIANSNRHKTSQPLGGSGFKAAIRAFSRVNKLVKTSGAPLLLQAQLIRPTMAWQEYMRTEDIRYLQTLLGHEKTSTTADYLRRVSDPIFKFRRGLHIEAMLLDVLSPQKNQSETVEVTSVMFNSCKNPRQSPVLGQKLGNLCTAGHEICLGCPNLVITHEDIKKYFCYMRYHNQLFESGFISAGDHRWATAEKKFVWEEQILPRYDSTILAAIQVDADLHPIEVWSTVAEKA
ncbi:hypothetical protein [Pseudomonas viridiflava]|uniref:hypothetical protein n=1 Tax=Pseudomonas viridiflava TaxID=33069 RepID=UPI002EC7E9EA|nr:hypothetical protein [Pseudomonas viridiflava]